jgi:hypothetical protein
LRRAAEAARNHRVPESLNEKGPGQPRSCEAAMNEAPKRPDAYGLLARMSGDGPRLARVRVSTKPASASQLEISSNE